MASCNRDGEVGRSTGKSGNANVNHVARPGRSQGKPPRKTKVDTGSGFLRLEYSLGAQSLATSWPSQHLSSALATEGLALLLLPSSFHSHRKPITFPFSVATVTLPPPGTGKGSVDPISPSIPWAESSCQPISWTGLGAAT